MNGSRTGRGRATGSEVSTMRGYVHVYTGDGKGKTTAALGLALRAAGAGLKVFIGQFIKMGAYSEIKALQRFEDVIRVEQFGRGGFVRGNPAPEDIAAARSGLERVRAVMGSGGYRVIVLDEANVAATCGLISVQELLGVILEKPPDVEMIITGRGAAPRILEAADLVTEMRPVKHYFEKGVRARVGIEN
jgi:cob(I)alamin adenosyltransferase